MGVLLGLYHFYFVAAGSRHKSKETFSYSKLTNEMADRGSIASPSSSVVPNSNSCTFIEGPLIDLNTVPPMAPLDPIEIPSYSNMTSVLDQPIDVPQSEFRQSSAFERI